MMQIQKLQSQDQNLWLLTCRSFRVTDCKGRLPEVLLSNKSKKTEGLMCPLLFEWNWTSWSLTSRLTKDLDSSDRLWKTWFLYFDQVLEKRSWNWCCWNSDARHICLVHQCTRNPVQHDKSSHNRHCFVCFYHHTLRSLMIRFHHHKQANNSSAALFVKILQTQLHKHIFWVFDRKWSWVIERKQYRQKSHLRRLFTWYNLECSCKCQKQANILECTDYIFHQVLRHKEINRQNIWLKYSLYNN